jgi:pimeloyl-ACP methyl ester carboxylesterase
VLADLESAARAVVAAVASGASLHRTGPTVWRRWGQGPPLVLLHGASGSWTHWIRNIPALATRFTVIVPDMPGFGDSGPPPEPPTVEAVAGLLVTGLDVVLPPSDELALAGFSFGGIVAGVVAARLGRRVRTLVLVGPGGLAVPYGPRPDLLAIEATMSPDEILRRQRANLAALMLADVASADPLAVVVHHDNLARARFRSGGIPTSDALSRALPAVRARITGIWGSRDVYVGEHMDARRRALAAWQPDLDFRVIEGAGHWVIYEAADAVNAALLDMLAGASRTAG